ncbi:MAG: hypothetical protein QOJ29_3885, partial [Thermoleophilaceae bacterium]|nr:hypothetical protein [Thermoleophilaceae bacterium]
MGSGALASKPLPVGLTKVDEALSSRQRIGRLHDDRGKEEREPSVDVTPLPNCLEAVV